MMTLREIFNSLSLWLVEYEKVFTFETNWLDAPILTLVAVIIIYFIFFIVIGMYLKELFEWLVNRMEHSRRLKQDEEYRLEWEKKPWKKRYPKLFAVLIYFAIMLFGIVWIIIFEN